MYGYLIIKKLYETGVEWLLTQNKWPCFLKTFDGQYICKRADIANAV